MSPESEKSDLTLAGFPESPHSLVHRLMKFMLRPSALAIQSGSWASLYVSAQREACFLLESFSLATNSGRISPRSCAFNEILTWFGLLSPGPNKGSHQLFTARVSYSLSQSLLFFMSKCSYCNRQIKSLQWHIYSNMSITKLRLCILKHKSNCWLIQTCCCMVKLDYMQGAFWWEIWCFSLMNFQLIISCRMTMITSDAVS